MKKYISGVIWSQILLQAFLPISGCTRMENGAFASSTASNVQHSEKRSEQNVAPQSSLAAARQSANDAAMLPYAAEMGQAARMLASGNASDSARSLAVGAASGELQQWFSQFGTARIQLNMDRHGSWSSSSADLLAPIYDNKKSLLFVQGGMRNPSDRLTGNLGFGVRTFWQNGWMYGGNVFMDKDFTGGNRRVGMGAEAWRDYLRLSTNIYLGTTDWHKSRDFDGTWQEKPADGYDIRAEGWLPAYPQLGAKLSWEQYYGNQVALFNKDNLQRNPYAATVGLEYTPIPLISLGVNQKQGKGEHDTQLALGVSWRFGSSWGWQTNPENVQTARTLAGSRYDLVDRNNEIVLQYRKKPEQGVAHLALAVVTDNSPADDATQNVLQVLATNRDGQPVGNAPINWSVPTDSGVNLTASAAQTDSSGLATVTLTSAKALTVPVTAQSGGVSASQDSHFIAVAVSHIALSITEDNAVADGSSTNAALATLTDGNNRPVTGQKVTWKVPQGVTVKEDQSLSDGSGKVTVHLTSTTAGDIAISATAGNQTANGTMHFTGDIASAKIANLRVTTDGSPADGTTANVAQVTVTDINGNALSGQAVTWRSDKPTVAFGPSTVTDSSGIATVTYTDTLAESLTLTATLANGNSATASSLFVADQNSARLKDFVVTSGATANGSDANTATVTVTDASGNPLANAAVTFTVTGSARLSATSISTNGSGQAQITLTDTLAETVQVTAKLPSGSSMTKDSSFIADLNSATLTVQSTTGTPADGSSTSTVTVTLKDNAGRAIVGEPITLTVTGSAALSAASGTTNGSGQVVVTLTDSVVETVTVTAAISSGKQATAEVAFLAFSVTNLTVNTDNVKANGVNSATITATVTTSSGQSVKNTPVTFSVTGSATLSSVTATTDSNGTAQVSATDRMGETVTITAKAQKSDVDMGKTVTLTFVESRITHINVKNSTQAYPRVFEPNSGFPETGFIGASFMLTIDSGTTPGSDYIWSSSQGWATVNGDGVVTLSGTPTSGTKNVTITAVPKIGTGTLTWSFSPSHWFTFSAGTMTPADADGYCSSIGQVVPSKDLLDYTDYGTTRVGSLWSEWSDSLQSSNSYQAVWASETGRYSRYYMFLYSGHIYDNAPGYRFGAVCQTDL
ncbi:Ig-like domain-containing protein [Leminorella grimontii]|uniref:Ig-like domain-containing protein n=1 Tax=Leminorella grimontii TaxID=82981 RepID=UPI00207E11E5|nr:inverse autotransporter beta domain-containing protein [Leminorella grimontii]GKX61034.1 hypothetical protein SOASR031_33490 [Leminorella grimontii]